jgi:biotin carboxyl carrier protein
MHLLSVSITTAADPICSEINAVVWKIEVAARQRVAAGDALIVLEAMKMEIPVAAPRAGVVAAILVAEKQMVAEGEALAVLD